MPTLDLANGYYTLPPGKLANIVTCLEMHTPAAPPAPALAAGLSVERLGPQDAALYRVMFRRVGQDLLWFSRLIMTDDTLERNLADPDIEAYLLRRGAENLGLFELNFAAPGVGELALFGLVADAVGHGLGKVMMQEAQRRAWARPIQRLWVHTCNYDHPRALRFYQDSGFQIFELMVEVHDDPRLAGHLPLDAAPQVPLLKR